LLKIKTQKALVSFSGKERSPFCLEKPQPTDAEKVREEELVFERRRRMPIRVSEMDASVGRK